MDVLINECTFSGDRQEQAIAKSHCTMEEAISVACVLKARYTALTHFSQRYPKNLNFDQGLEVRSTQSLQERAGDCGEGEEA